MEDNTTEGMFEVLGSASGLNRMKPLSDPKYQSLQESEHKKACILSHNVFSHQSVSSSKRASTGASGGGKIFSQAFACIFGPKELLIIKEPGNTTTGTHNSKN